MISFPPGGRLESNGDLIFPTRGQPPKYAIQGFVKSKSDPYRYKMIIPLCQFRVLKEEFYQKCGCIGTHITCKFFNKAISLSKCYNCPEAKTDELEIKPT